MSSGAVIIILRVGQDPEFFFDAESDAEFAELRKELAGKMEALKKWFLEIFSAAPQQGRFFPGKKNEDS